MPPSSTRKHWRVSFSYPFGHWICTDTKYKTLRAAAEAACKKLGVRLSKQRLKILSDENNYLTRGGDTLRYAVGHYSADDLVD